MTFLKKFSVRTPDDDNDDCEVKNVIMLDVGTVIVTDIKNAIKAFDMDGAYLDSIVPSTEMDGEGDVHFAPSCVGMRCFGLTAVSGNGFAVTLNRSDERGRGDTQNKMIGFFELVFTSSGQKVRTKKLVPTRRRYMTLAVLPNKKLLGGTSGGVNVMTSEGEELGLMTSEIEFKTPYHVRVTESGKVVIADSEKTSILIFDSRGRLEKHVHLGYFGLRGIAATDGAIFLVHRKQDYVLMVSPDEGQVFRIRATEERLNDPQAVFLDRRGLLLIAEMNKVKIFTIDDYEKIVNRAEWYRMATSLLRKRTMTSLLFIVAFIFLLAHYVYT